MAGTIHSMTGFARTEGRIAAPAAAHWVWETRSVNGKGLDVRIRMPPGFESLDAAARQAVAERVSRGSITATLTVTSTVDAAEIRLNEPLLERLIAVAAAKVSAAPGVLAPARIDGLLAVKGVIDVQQPTLSPEQATARDRALIDGLAAAIADLTGARRQEGARLMSVIGGQITAIAALAAQAAAVGAAQPESIRTKLTRQVAELAEGVAVSPDRLAQEIALMAVKGDIREEIDRLTAHVAQARDMLAAGGPCGRKLDFLSQELNREANTLCSKSQDVALTRVGLDLKAVIDQFREQIQNIE
jgi:uncharacterized protein (TIGR00255 family)